MVHCRVIYLPNGEKHYFAVRDFLRRRSGGYKEPTFLIDELEVDTNNTGQIVEAKALYHYDPSRSDYFEGHFGGVFPGLGGHGEMMAQASAMSYMLVNGSGKRILLQEVHIKPFYPVKGKKDLLAVVRQVEASTFDCKLYQANQYELRGEDARLLSTAWVKGKAV